MQVGYFVTSIINFFKINCFDISTKQMFFMCKNSSTVLLHWMQKMIKWLAFKVIQLRFFCFSLFYVIKRHVVSNVGNYARYFLEKTEAAF